MIANSMSQVRFFSFNFLNGQLTSRGSKSPVYTRTHGKGSLRPPAPSAQHLRPPGAAIICLLPPMIDTEIGREIDDR